MHSKLPVLFIAIASLFSLHTGSTQAALNGANPTPLNGKDGFAQLNESMQDLVQEQVQYLSTLVEEQVKLAKQEILTNLSQSLAPILTFVQKQDQLTFGKVVDNPARSCRSILDTCPDSTSGYYWIQSTSCPVRVYCDMTRTCNGITGGWMQVANIDMNNQHSCPSGLATFTDTRRRCANPSTGAGCASTTFSVHDIPYQRVCGRIIGYQYSSIDAFYPYYNNRWLTIDDGYVDGMSLTHGQNPRKHLWTFAAAVDEHVNGRVAACLCSNRAHSDIVVPPFVANDYFCDTGSRGRFEYGRLYYEDPLWDGAGCGSVSTCCSFNNPPWFMKPLSYTTSDNIELRLCRDQERGNEDASLKIVELYVQ